MGDAEVEWQFEAQDLRLVEGWLRDRAIPSAPNQDHLDTYLDTADCRLERDGYSARLRRAEGAPVVATLKSLGDVDEEGLSVRLELEEEIALTDPLDLAHAPGVVGRRVRDLVGERELHPLFDVDTRRSVFPLSAGGELLLDDTTIREPGGGKLLGRLQRVEIEVPEDAVTAVRPLVDSLRRDLALQPAESSKYEAARALSGLDRPDRTMSGSPAGPILDPSSRKDDS
jgi:inorganic triphosphatase YgiF